jgi:hypothetical protein
MMTHEEVRAKYERVEREEMPTLDAIITTRHRAGPTQYRDSRKRRESLAVLHAV